jgi:hypothetical protein
LVPSLRHEANAGPAFVAAHANFSKEPGVPTHPCRDITRATRDVVPAV